MTPFLKTCSKCHRQKWNSEFSKHKKTKDGLQSYCKDCCSGIAIEKRTPENSRKNLLKTKYNMTEEDYELILQSQNEKCAICNQSETKKNQNGDIRRLSIDHCHKTGKVRELLCDKCNIILGRVRDDIKILETIIKYLKKHQ